MRKLGKVPVATLYFLHISRPANTSSSVIIGSRSKWSIIFAIEGSETLMAVGLAAILVFCVVIKILNRGLSGGVERSFA